MRFLIDESSDARFAGHLRRHGHDAIVIGVDYPGGLDDQLVLQLAYRDQRILITSDRDFGTLTVVRQQPHNGVILFRLSPFASLTLKVSRLEHVLTHFASQLDQFLVVTHDRVRVRESSQS